MLSEYIDPTLTSFFLLVNEGRVERIKIPSGGSGTRSTPLDPRMGLVI